MNPNVCGRSDRGHRLPFGEDLRVWSDAHFEILRPDALCDERILDGARLRRAWPDVPEGCGRSTATIACRTASALLASPRACSSMTRSRRLATNVTPLALIA